MSNPYTSMPSKAFWKAAIAEKNALEIEQLHSFKYAISRDDKVVTAGSCFAQHIGRAMKAQGFNWFDAEPGPATGLMTPELRKKYGYGVFSFRTGNIYTTSLLRQWVWWAFGKAAPSEEVWRDAAGRFYDPFRPAIEPDGFASAEEVMAARELTLGAIRTAVRECSVFVFTLGLTEGWLNVASGVDYPMCPGTHAGEFDAQAHVFKNYTSSEIHSALSEVIAFCREVNPDIRFLLTVSPVPLTATASGKHVLVATTYSKSVLRAVAGEVADAYDYVDYFPSYEIIASAPFRGMFYKPNQREVSPKGVDVVMGHFFAAMGIDAHAAPERPVRRERAGGGGRGGGKVSGAPAEPGENAGEAASADDVECEEALLEVFGSGAEVAAR